MAGSNVIVMLTALLVAAAAPGAEPADSLQANTTRPAATQPETGRYDRQMTVSPAKAEDALPASQAADVFAFTQRGPEVRHENAAPYYLQATTWLQRSRDAERDERFEHLEKVPMLELDADEAREQLAVLGQLQYTLSEPAVRRTWADWGVSFEEEGINTPVPWVTELRLLARRMGQEARVQAAEGRFEGSARMLQRMFVLADQLGNARRPAPVLGFVGVGIATLATDCAAQISQLPDAPNRYWALTTLPAPMFDVPSLLDSERVLVSITLPALSDPEKMTADRWRQTLLAWRSATSDSEEEDPHAALFDEAKANAVLESQARPYLKERGYTDQQILALGTYGAVATYLMDDYRTRFESMAKLVHLPFHEAYPRIAALQNPDPVLGASASGLLAESLLPSFSRAITGPCQVQRQIAALRVVEAVRDHAAHHEGRLPASLVGLRLPIPADPATAQPFDYRLEGATFTLMASPYDQADVHSGFVWRVTMRE